MAKKFDIETRDLSSLYFVKHQFRSDLNFFTDDLNILFEKLSTQYNEKVYEVQFWLAIPKFKKLTKAQLRKLMIGSATLNEKGWHKDHYNYNKAERWEVKPAKRKTPARNTKKR